MPKTYKIEISARTIIFIVFFLLFLKLLWIIRDLLFSLFIAFIVMSAVKPAVIRLEKFRIPRPLSTLIIFIGFIFGFAYLFYWFLPPLVYETAIFFKSLPQILTRLAPNLLPYPNFSALTQYLPNITNQFFSLVKGIFSNAIFLISTIFFSFYFVIEEDFIKKILVRFFEEEKTQSVVSIFNKIEERLRAWFWGELVLMMVVGLMTYVGLTLIGVRHAAFLAVVAGVLEVVPNLGPTISTIPAVLVASSQSYFLGLSTLALYFIVQQLENNLIVPMVMRKAVGLNPIVTLIALIIGGKIGGVLGVILAIPMTLFIESILIEIIKNRAK
ncbi:MAG: AI-2E family transporter [Microgenomates group bacterium]